MNVSTRRLGLMLGVAILLVPLVGPITDGDALSVQARPVPGFVNPPMAQTMHAASLHNPTFDKTPDGWYYFNERYAYVPTTDWSMMPDDDIPHGPQDWRIWYYGGTEPIKTWPSTLRQQGEGSDRSIAARTYASGQHQAGVYQIIYNTTPCMYYEFGMYGMSKADAAWTHEMRVGIDRAGYFPSNVAVTGFPSTTVWGDSKYYYWTYGPLSVTADAWGSTITVFARADGFRDKPEEVRWDTGSFQALPDLLLDPNNPPAPGGINGLGVDTTGTSATLSWTTSQSAISQVYYRLVSGPTTPSAPAGPYFLYMPVMSRNYPSWLSTTIDDTVTSSHSVPIDSLLPGATYEYIVVSRGVTGGQCATWVATDTFTTDVP
jgi:hypothetical protein